MSNIRLTEEQARQVSNAIVMNHRTPEEAYSAVANALVEMGVLCEPRTAGPYGWCPICGADGSSRERRLNGNDTCRGGHVYPSVNAVYNPYPPKAPEPAKVSGLADRLADIERRVAEAEKETQ